MEKILFYINLKGEVKSVAYSGALPNIDERFIPLYRTDRFGHTYMFYPKDTVAIETFNEAYKTVVRLFIEQSIDLSKLTERNFIFLTGGDFAKDFNEFVVRNDYKVSFPIAIYGNFDLKKSNCCGVQK